MKISSLPTFALKFSCGISGTDQIHALVPCKKWFRDCNHVSDCKFCSCVCIYAYIFIFICNI